MHEEDCPPGWFGSWLTEAGMTLDVCPAYRRPLPPDLQTYDGLLVLGGDMGAYDDATHPWLTMTKALIRDAVAQRLPFLGICLGHQLAAVALGGSVEVNAHGHARGITPLGLTSAGIEDELFHVTIDEAPALQWNHDVVTTLPPGATLLATDPDLSVQAVNFAPRAWGVQFHPEAGSDIFARWVRERLGHAPPARVDVAAAYAEVRKHERDLERAWKPLAERFAAITADAAVARVA